MPVERRPRRVPESYIGYLEGIFKDGVHRYLSYYSDSETQIYWSAKHPKEFSDADLRLMIAKAEVAVEEFARRTEKLIEALREMLEPPKPTPPSTRTEC